MVKLDIYLLLMYIVLFLMADNTEKNQLFAHRLKPHFMNRQKTCPQIWIYLITIYESTDEFQLFYN